MQYDVLWDALFFYSFFGSFNVVVKVMQQKNMLKKKRNE